MNIISLIYIESDLNKKIEDIAKQNIDISKTDWDSFETSWDFEQHPFIQDTNLIETAFDKWQKDCKTRFDTLKANEEELNEIFIGIYGLGAELTKDVADKDVTVYTADVKADVKRFISYFVGCLFGRYSLDDIGLIFAGGTFDDTKYKKFTPVKDNVVIINDDDYFNDDIYNRFKEFVSVIYGTATLKDNLQFIADALGVKGDVDEGIRNYFVKDFYKDHVKTYKKCPIYWLYDAGSKNSFKALIYMHRYEPTTTNTVRLNFVHKMLTQYSVSITDADTTIKSTTATPGQKKTAQKLKDKLTKQETELKTYDNNITGLAGSSIAIDLDDGVKVNHAKIQTYKGTNKGILAKL